LKGTNVYVKPSNQPINLPNAQPSTFMMSNTNKATVYNDEQLIAVKDDHSQRVASLYYEKLQKLLFVEHHHIQLLAKAKKIADGTILKSAINQLVQSGQLRKDQLTMAFAAIGTKPSMTPSQKYEGLTQEFESCVDTADVAIRNAAIVYQIQSISEYKIAEYSELCELAEAYNDISVSKIAEELLQSEICNDAFLMDLGVDYLGNEEIDIDDFISED
jgi:ferritin-like metal-binding protein YciE